MDEFECSMDSCASIVQEGGDRFTPNRYRGESMRTATNLHPLLLAAALGLAIFPSACDGPPAAPVDASVDQHTVDQQPAPDMQPRVYHPETGVKTIHANGIDIAYFEAGQGPLVVLLHGFPDTPHTWDEIVPALTAAGYHTVAPFLRGYAPSGIPPMDTTIDQQGRDVLGLIAALGEQHAILVGHDWGALSAYTAAAYSATGVDPIKIDKLVTIAIAHPIALLKHTDIPPAPHFMELIQPNAVQMVQADDFHYLDELLVRWSPHWQVPVGELEPVKNAFTAPGSLNAALGYYRNFANLSLPPQLLQPLPMPALTFYGTDDQAVSQVPFADQASAFTGPFELVALPTGHFVHREAESDFVAKLLAFLGQ
jgi:pimeloyl-ACP methyl ester carboxylesterase